MTVKELRSVLADKMEYFRWLIHDIQETMDRIEAMEEAGVDSEVSEIEMV